MGWIDKLPPARTIGLLFGATFTLFAPLAVGWMTRDGGITTVVALCGAFVSLLVKVDDLVELSLGPVRAKMRETIQQAAATIDQLQDLALVSARAQLTQLARGSFGFGTGNRLPLLQMREEIVQTLRTLGISESKISDSQSEWRRGIACVYHRYVPHYLGAARDRGGLVFEGERNVPAAKEVQALLHFETWTAAPPDALEEVLVRYDVFTDELKEWLDDYRHFISHGVIRNKEKFAVR